VLRQLVLRGRASVLSTADRAALEAAAAEAAAAAAAAAAGPPKSLEDAMTEAGLLKSNPKVMMRQMHKMLEVRSSRVLHIFPTILRIHFYQNV